MILSSSADPFLLQLPVEIVYHIFDYIDISTLLLSLSHVCTHLRKIILTYNRYELDFSSVSKGNFHRLCQLIRSENTTALTLSDDYRSPGQIKLFFSSFRINEFIRLISLSLFDVDENDLNEMLRFDLPLSLKSFAVDWRVAHRPIEQTLKLLSSLFSRLNLFKVQLKSGSYALEEMIWPNQCSIQHLTLMYITHKQYCHVLRQMPFLQTLVLNHCSMHQIDETVMNQSIPQVFPQLISLTLTETRIAMSGLESLLSLTPSLTYLKIVCSPDSFDAMANGFRWEDFIRRNLIHLHQFQFIFTNIYNVYYQSRDVQLLISRFQTSFWLEEKHWFVTCDYMNYFNQVMLYTIPICTNDFTYEPESNKISYSNLINIDHHLIVTNVTTLNVNLTILKLAVTGNRENLNLTSDRCFFPNVSKLTIDIDREWSTDYIEHLSTIIDLSRLEKITLNPDLNPQFIQNTIESFHLLMKLADHLQSLSIHPYFSHNDDDDNVTYTKYICSFIPNHIKHLEISVRNLDNMKQIFHFHERLWSLAFSASSDQSINWTDFLPTLMETNEDFTHWQSYYSLRIWLNRR